MGGTTTQTKGKLAWSDIARSNVLFLGLLLAVLLIGLTLASDRFLTGSNAIAILHQCSMVLIVAVGMTFLLSTGEVDISVGASMGFASCVIMDVINHTGSLTLGILAAIAFGACVGLFNGFLVVVLKINSLIGTIATMMILQGGIFLYTREAIQNHHQLPLFPKLATGFIFGIPVPVIIASVALLLGWLVFAFLKQGRQFLAVGANFKAARLSGISPERVKLMAFLINGILVGIAAAILSSLLNAGQPTAGRGFELIVIAAVLLGGTSLFGGRATLIGTLFGVLILKIIDNGIIILGLNQDLQIIVPGVVLIVALFIDQLQRGDAHV